MSERSIYSKASTPSLVDIALHRIKNAEDIERAGRKFDPLFEYHYFDRNRALHNFYANQQGKTIGTCAHESKMYAAQLVLSGKHKHKDVQLIAQTMRKQRAKRVILRQLAVASFLSMIFGYFFLCFAPRSFAWSATAACSCSRFINSLSRSTSFCLACSISSASVASSCSIELVCACLSYLREEKKTKKQRKKERKKKKKCEIKIINLTNQFKSAHIKTNMTVQPCSNMWKIK